MSVAAVNAYLRTSECGIVAAAALLAFDYCLTFGQEVEWLHRTRWTAARIHFISLRYLPFPAVVMGILTCRSATSYCGSLGTATYVVYYLCIIFAEAMLIVRTYAFWKRNRKVLIGMCTFGTVCMVAAIVTSQTIASQPTNSVYKALDCSGVENTVSTAIQFACLIIYETGMLCLNWIAFRRMRRQSSPSQFVTTLYRDGVMYVAAILVFSAINAIVTLSTPIQYSALFNSLVSFLGATTMFLLTPLLDSPQMVAHSILASRIFFNLKQTMRLDESTPSVTLSEFHAAPPRRSGSADLELE